MTIEYTISTEMIGTHEKELSFHASPYPDERPHIMAIYIDGYLDQYVSLSDDAIDMIIEKREAMRAQIETDTAAIKMRETTRIVNYLYYDSDLLNIIYNSDMKKDRIAKMIDISRDEVNKIID